MSPPTQASDGTAEGALAAAALVVVLAWSLGIGPALAGGPGAPPGGSDDAVRSTATAGVVPAASTEPGNQTDVTLSTARARIDASLDETVEIRVLVDGTFEDGHRIEIVSDAAAAWEPNFLVPRAASDGNGTDREAAGPQVSAPLARFTSVDVIFLEVDAPAEAAGSTESITVTGTIRDEGGAIVDVVSTGVNVSVADYGVELDVTETAFLVQPSELIVTNFTIANTGAREMTVDLSMEGCPERRALSRTNATVPAQGHTNLSLARVAPAEEGSCALTLSAVARVHPQIRAEAALPVEVREVSTADPLASLAHGEVTPEVTILAPVALVAVLAMAVASLRF